MRVLVERDGRTLRGGVLEKGRWSSSSTDEADSIDAVSMLSHETIELVIVSYELSSRTSS
jgi:hypothetical protein